ncbi:MAG: hypothetical protein E7633_08675 [Ruminococcaceae bacterium]|nr:hypothetical protein [Oscillospiraceae bacterium]
MAYSRKHRIIAFLLAVLVLVAPGTAAMADDTNDGYQSASLSDLLQVSKYKEYLIEHEGTEKGTKNYLLTGDDIINYNADITNADTDTLKTLEFTDLSGKTYKGLYLPSDGVVGWDIPFDMEEGMYAVKFKYVPIAEEAAKATAIERTFYINEEVPYYEARYLTFSKVWKDDADTYQKDADGNVIYRYMSDNGKIVYEYVDKNDNILERTVENNTLTFKKTGKKLTDTDKKGLYAYPVFANDIDGNESKPGKIMVDEVSTYVATDSSGYYIEALQFYFPAGRNTIQLEAQREAMVLLEVEIFPYDYETDEFSYDEYINYWKESGAKDVADFYQKIQAEYPTATSENTVYPFADRTSSINEPQSPYIQYLNAIGGDGGEKWQGVGQWARYTVNVDESGFYEIVLRFRQSVNEGAFSSRIIRVATQSMINNGEDAIVPFKEANYLRFNFDDSWQTEIINSAKKDKNGELITYKVYLEKGTNYIEFEAGLGDMAGILLDVTESLNTITDIYVKILMITGSEPDKYRDYGFYNVIPTEMNELLVQANKLYDLADKLQAEVGSGGSYTATLRTVAQLLERMGESDSKVAANLSNLKENLGSIGTWIQNCSKQPLELDYIVVRSPGSGELPKANANFFQAMWFEICQFFKSFTSDYSQLGATVVSDPDNKIEVWTTLGRDQAQVLRSLINSDFAKNYTEANVDLKLVAGGALLPSVLAGVGPDVSHGHGAGDVINWAIRSAVQPLDEFEGFDDIYDWFAPASWIPLTLYDLRIENGKEVRSEQVYGLPEGLDFLMMFYRADVLNELGLTVPKTWEEMRTVMDTLSENNMQIAFPTYLGGHDLFLYQMGGERYADDGRRINYDSDKALESFAYITSLFTDFGQPLTYDFANRFRTGEIPIGIVGYSSYTHLSIFATEIQGLWEFVPLPAWTTYNEDGTISNNNSAVASTSAIIMLADDSRSEKLTNFAWKFMKWYVSETTQADYANELTALFGSEYKYTTANKEALASLSWTTSEYNNLMGQFNNLVGIEEYPGGYIIGRYLTFAFNEVYNDGADAEEALLKYIYDINVELTRKRQEFGMAYFEVSFDTNYTEEKN